ncbi:hypothetical protein T12_8211 [Trichinella patagoniensis]|uniref:Uncharacterized protein n=1 Tax=Trichinella patagoniensis TaxID=990121 RepID=A0A0V0ZML5_9BILA|nr:hypothetical protein T12_8211 [Trichinella patagoniensis]
MGPLYGNNHTTANAVVTRCRASTTLRNVVWNCRRVLYACGAQVQICQTFVRQAIESGQYNVDSSWPTECGQSRRRSRGLNESGSNTPRIRVRFIRQRTIRRTYSVDSSEQRCPSVSIYPLLFRGALHGPLYRARGRRPRRVARTANEQLAHCGGACYLWRRSKSPSASY